MEDFAQRVPAVLLLPFALLLAAIAVLPLWAGHFWESHHNKARVTALLSLPVVAYLALVYPHGLAHAALEYASFIALLGALYIVAGGIHVSGDLSATPRNNTLLLALGSVLANLLGTTGASMLLIRVLLRSNSERQRTAHVPFFFILLASNCGGLLTPLGDPPLFLGYLRGVPFTWTLGLWPYWLVANVYLLSVFYVVDQRAYRRERPRDLAHDARAFEAPRLHGWSHVALLLLVIGAVFLPTPLRELTMVVASLLSLFALDRAPRQRNHFTFAPIVEVAILFAGVFITMVPALALMQHHSPELGLVAPWQFFLVTGGLSSVLDNAPTYLTFLSAAQGLGLSGELIGVSAAHLTAISLGAVFMGANTYIGNGPNFMVRAVAEEAGVRMPSFLGYAWRASVTLAPLYVIVLVLLSLLS